MTTILDSIRGEYQRYKSLAEGSIAQLDDRDLVEGGPSRSSIATICWHVSGNLRSRFTDFLASDGEKSWRRREEEFLARVVTRSELLAKWQEGWDVLLSTLAALTDDQLAQTIAIRGESLLVVEALHRSLAHTAYHVGQIVYIAKELQGHRWKYLSIPPGGSNAYNPSPTPAKAPAQTSARSDAPRATED